MSARKLFVARFGCGSPEGSSLPSCCWAQSITPSASTPYCIILKSSAIQLSCFFHAFPLTYTSSWGKSGVPPYIHSCIPFHPPPLAQGIQPGSPSKQTRPLPAKYHFRLLGHGSAGLSLAYMRAPTTFRPDVGVAREPLLL